MIYVSWCACIIAQYVRDFYCRVCEKQMLLLLSHAVPRKTATTVVRRRVGACHAYVFNWMMAAAVYTLKPSDRRHALCASILSAHASSPFSITHSSRGLRVSGHAQQIRQVGFFGSAVLALLSAALLFAAAFGSVIAAAALTRCSPHVDWRRARDQWDYFYSRNR